MTRYQVFYERTMTGSTLVEAEDVDEAREMVEEELGYKEPGEVEWDDIGWTRATEVYIEPTPDGLKRLGMGLSE